MIDHPRAESALNQVADTLVPAIELFRVFRIQLLHQTRDRMPADPEQQVEVIPEQTVRDAAHVEAREPAAQQLHEQLTIVVVGEDTSFLVPARHDVVLHAGDMNTEWTGHAAGRARGSP